MKAKAHRADDAHLAASDAARLIDLFESFIWEHVDDTKQLAYSVPDAARLLDLSDNTIWNLLRQGKLNKVPDLGDRQVRISREELLRFLRTKEIADGDAKKQRQRCDAA